MACWNFYSIVPTLHIAQLHHFGELSKTCVQISFETKVTYARTGIVQERIQSGHFLGTPHGHICQKNVQHQQGCYIIIYNAMNGTRKH